MPELDLLFVKISELQYEEGGKLYSVGGKITGCLDILTGLRITPPDNSHWSMIGQHFKPFSLSI